MKALTKLSIKYGYTTRFRLKRTDERRAEVLSNIIGYCVRKEAGYSKMKLPDCSEPESIGQQIYRLREIVRHRKLDLQESDSQIVKFLNRCKLPLPSQIALSPHNLGVVQEVGKSASKKWSIEELNYLQDDAEMMNFITDSRATSKKKT